MKALTANCTEVFQSHFSMQYLTIVKLMKVSKKVALTQMKFYT